MKYVKFKGGTSYCGCDFEEYEKYEDNITNEELDDILNEMIMDNAQSYEHCATGWNGSFEDEDEECEYYDSAYGDWTFISEEEFLENA